MVIQWELTIPQLSGERKRKAYIYLPESYDVDPEKRYPVTNMQTGFGEQTIIYSNNMRQIHQHPQSVLRLSPPAHILPHIFANTCQRF